MKIAVYTICKNESQFIDKWLNSAWNADHLLIVDTGSTDNTLSFLKEAQQNYTNLQVASVKIDPWRFDDARNFSLNLLPSDIDICICLDMDEVLTEGWREVVEANWRGDTDRLRYNYIWNWNEDGTPGVTYHADKIHRRHGLRWRNPVHEVLVKDARLGDEKQVFMPNTLIEHYADNSKSRSSYLPLLELSTKENPFDDRSAHYYARELYFFRYYLDAITEFKRHLSLPSATWKSERAASLRYMGDCYWALKQYSKAVESFEFAHLEAPGEREALVSLAQAHRAIGNWDKVVEYCQAALKIKDKPVSYINQPSAWSDWPQTMLTEALERLSSAA